MLIVSQSIYAAPSFDCTKTSGAVEEMICRSDSQVLQALDVSLGKAYSTFRKSLPDGYRKLLLTSQRRWLARREVQCTYSGGLQPNCLQNLYGERINELENGLIGFTVPVNELPWSVTDGEGKTVRISQTEKKVISDEYDGEVTIQQVFVHTGERIDGMLHKGESGDRVNTTIKTIRMLFTAENGQVLIVDPGQYFGPVSHPMDIELLRYFINDRLAGSMERVDSEAVEIVMGGGSYYSSSTYHSHLLWHRDETSGALLLIETERMGNYSSGNGSIYRHAYIFNFEHSTITKQKEPYIERDLEDGNRQRADRYVRMMNEIMASVMERTAEDDKEHVSTDDLVSILNAMDGRVISWAQFIYAAKKLSDRTGEIRVPDRLIHLGKILLRYQRVIESTPNWEEKLKKISREAPRRGTHAWDEYVQRLGFTDKYFIAEGFPALQTSELGDGWLYGFWLRRYLNGHF
jgi:uncharacterized protein